MGLQILDAARSELRRSIPKYVGNSLYVSNERPEPGPHRSCPPSAQTRLCHLSFSIARQFPPTAQWRQSPFVVVSTRTVHPCEPGLALRGSHRIGTIAFPQDARQNRDAKSSVAGAEEEA